MTPATENLIALYERNAQRDEDLQWYADARALIHARADRLQMDHAVYAGVVAAMSPMTRWETKNGAYPNLDAADHVIKWQRGLIDKPGTMRTSAQNALRIISGENPDNVLGPKTRAFYHALMGADDVVLDRWALRAIGWPRESITERELERAAAPYHEAAQHLNVSPSALQAATWAQIRRESNNVA